MKTYNYKKSFLLFLHIILGLILGYLTFVFIAEYLRKDKIVGIILSLLLFFAYLGVMKYTSKTLNKQKVGMAYFLTIGGFLFVVFLQITTCTTIMPMPALMH